LTTGICTDCPIRERCVRLCRKAKRYANQDYVRQHEVLPNHLPEVTMEIAESTKNNEIFILEQFFLHQRSQVEIAANLEISKQYVSRIIRKYKTILKAHLRKSVDSQHSNKGSV